MLWTTRSRALRVIDGDTLTMESDLGRSIFHTADIRLLGVQAPELKQVGGVEARAFVERWIAENSGASWWFLLTTYKTAGDRDAKTFDRWLGTITTLDGSRNLNVDVQAFIHANGWGAGQ